MLTSSVCRYEDFFSDWYQRWAGRLKLDRPDIDPNFAGSTVQRKAWEWCAIAQALEERGMLAEGKTGCGFAVGTEPLASAFASLGVRVLGTDQPLETGTGAWAAGNQHAASLEALYHHNIIDLEGFKQKIRFKPVDMRDLGLPWGETYDFIWSSCSFEHLGTLETGMTFVLNAMELVKPGGVAVHTTEFNLSSNLDTVEEGANVIYRKQDLERLEGRLRKLSCAVSVFDLYGGDHQHDIEYDYPPYGSHGRQHVKLLLHDYVVTSVALIIRKGRPPASS
jgi:2-polyprenyl-3-methyl-5-hydroxy-6-metoxy-1,4-benzoquinol methylase